VNELHDEDNDPACWSWPLPATPIPDDEGSQRKALLAWQAERCGICEGQLHGLDHDYVTGLARGWLCAGCNNRETRSRSVDDVFARWRACPASAVLGVRFVSGVADRDWTGPTFLPEWAPPHHDWPHAHSAGPRPLVIPNWLGEAAAVMDDELARIFGDRPQRKLD